MPLLLHDSYYSTPGGVVGRPPLAAAGPGGVDSADVAMTSTSGDLS